jgi:hypothetical protein
MVSFCQNTKGAYNHQANIFQYKVQSVHTIHYGIPYCLHGVRKNNYKSFLSSKYCWRGCSVSTWNIMLVFTISCEGTFIIKIMSIIWYINIQVFSSSKTHCHVDI